MRMKLHLGCGKRNFGEGWINVDKSTKFDHVYYHDILKLPFKKESTNLIYASHLIAYLDENEIKAALKEWKRVLIPGGILRLATPDFNAINEIYKTTGKILLGPLYGKMNIDSYEVYHKTVYDFESIKKLLLDNGFKGVREYNWRETEHAQFDDHSQAYMPHMDKENGVLISLNVEAIK